MQGGRGEGTNPNSEFRGFAPIGLRPVWAYAPEGVLACPGASCLGCAIVAVILRKRGLWNTGRVSQVWARE